MTASSVADRVRRSSQHSRPYGRSFCGIMLRFGKPVAEPTSDATQARGAMANHGSSTVIFYPLVLVTFLRLWYGFAIVLSVECLLCM